MVVHAIPAIAFEEAVNDVLGMRMFPVDGTDSGEFRTEGGIGHIVLSRESISLSQCSAGRLSQPCVQSRRNKLIVVQMWIEPANAINLFGLPGREVLIGIETPAAGQQTLPAEHLMNPRNASAKPIRRIEEGRVRICDLVRERQHFGGNPRRATSNLLHAL
jgi:hypothetical protein